MTDPEVLARLEMLEGKVAELRGLVVQVGNLISLLNAFSAQATTEEYRAAERTPRAWGN